MLQFTETTRQNQGMKQQLRLMSGGKEKLMPDAYERDAAVILSDALTDAAYTMAAYCSAWIDGHVGCAGCQFDYASTCNIGEPSKWTINLVKVDK
jgi:hypothetical protein